MTIINLNLPDDLKAQVERREAEGGYTKITDYVEELLRADSHDVDYGAPPHLTVKSAEDFEAKLLEGLNGPAGREGVSHPPRRPHGWVEPRERGE